MSRKCTDLGLAEPETLHNIFEQSVLVQAIVSRVSSASPAPCAAMIEFFFFLPPVLVKCSVAAFNARLSPLQCGHDGRQDVCTGEIVYLDVTFTVLEGGFAQQVREAQREIPTLREHVDSHVYTQYNDCSSFRCGPFVCSQHLCPKTCFGVLPDAARMCGPLKRNKHDWRSRHLRSFRSFLASCAARLMWLWWSESAGVVPVIPRDRTAANCSWASGVVGLRKGAVLVFFLQRLFQHRLLCRKSRNWQLPDWSWASGCPSSRVEVSHVCCGSLSVEAWRRDGRSLRKLRLCVCCNR